MSAFEPSVKFEPTYLAPGTITTNSSYTDEVMCNKCNSRFRVHVKLVRHLRCGKIARCYDRQCPGVAAISM